MSGPIALVIGATITAILCFAVAWRWRGRMVPVGWRAFVAMALGCISIAAFYVNIANLHWLGERSSKLIPYSRVLWWFIIISTALMALSVLVINENGDEDE